MIELYLFNEGYASCVYGIDSYINQLVNFLSKKRTLSLTLFLSQCYDVKEYTIKKKRRYGIIFVFGIVSVNNQFYKNIWLLIRAALSVSDFHSLIFYFNYPQEFPLLLLINFFSKCIIIFVVHYVLLLSIEIL